VKERRIFAFAKNLPNPLRAHDVLKIVTSNKMARFLLQMVLVFVGFFFNRNEGMFGNIKNSTHRC